MALKALRLIPGLSGGPSMVNVLPEPVWPYAKMHTLYPVQTTSQQQPTILTGMMQSARGGSGFVHGRSCGQTRRARRRQTCTLFKFMSRLVRTVGHTSRQALNPLEDLFLSGVARIHAIELKSPSCAIFSLRKEGVRAKGQQKMYVVGVGCINHVTSRWLLLAAAAKHA